MTKVLIAIGLIATIAIGCCTFTNKNKGNNSDYFNW